MRVFLAGAGLLLASFLVQLVLWRIALPKSQTRALLVLFAVVPLCAVALAWLGGYSLRFSAPQAVRLLLAYVAFALAYIVLYSAIENQSPTLAIVSLVAEAGPNGCSSTELFAGLSHADAMTNRVAVLEQSGLVALNRDRITLTSEGRMYAELFERAAAFFGLAKGG